jgi:hypothetical protein
MHPNTTQFLSFLRDLHPLPGIDFEIVSDMAKSRAQGESATSHSVLLNYLTHPNFSFLLAKMRHSVRLRMSAHSALHRDQ